MRFIQLLYASGASPQIWVREMSYKDEEYRLRPYSKEPPDLAETNLKKVEAPEARKDYERRDNISQDSQVKLLSRAYIASEQRCQTQSQKETKYKNDG